MCIYFGSEDGLMSEHFLHGAVLTEGGMMSASGLPFSIENAVADLTEIVVCEDFELVITGDYASHVRVGVYNQEFAHLFDMGDAFIAPVYPGVFTVFVDVTWSNDACTSQFGGFTAIRYVFRILVE